MNNIEIDGIVFPATYINGIFIIDYPNQPQKKITEKEENIKKLNKYISDLIKENNIKFDFS